MCNFTEDFNTKNSLKIKDLLKIATVLFIGLTFFTCSKEEWIEEAPQIKIVELNFPEEAKEWGELFAKNLNFVTKKAKQQKIRFEDKEQIYISTQRSSIEFFQKNRLKSAKSYFLENDTSEIRHEMIDVLKNNLSVLSKKQIEIFKLITDARSESDSYIAFSSRLVEINDIIYKTIPDSEQSRLFFVTSTLYYGLKEINNLVKEGVIPGSPEGDELTISSSVRLKLAKVRLKSANMEDDDDLQSISWWSSDNSGSLLSSIWLIAFAELPH